MSATKNHYQKENMYNKPFELTFGEEIPSEPQQDLSYDPNYRHERMGNNRKKISKTVAKARRKMAKVSQRKNRSK